MISKLKSVQEWRDHWDKKANIESSVEINGYCVGGTPIPEEKYYNAVVLPNIQTLQLEKHHRVLDIGCGTGLMLKEIEKLAQSAVGTDLSKSLLDRFDGVSETHVCAAHELPFNEEEFDRVLMTGVAIYFPDFNYFKRVVEKVISIMKPDGLFLIGDLNVGRRPRKSQYFWYDRKKLLDYVEELGYPYTFTSQNKLKRTINTRWDLIIRKEIAE